MVGMFCGECWLGSLVLLSACLCGVVAYVVGWMVCHYGFNFSLFRRSFPGNL